jgi:hypothetical protein
MGAEQVAVGTLGLPRGAPFPMAAGVPVAMTGTLFVPVERHVPEQVAQPMGVAAHGPDGQHQCEEMEKKAAVHGPIGCGISPSPARRR